MNVTIILPIRNEANFIKQSIVSILAQDYPQDQIEILLADGMSTDGTREIINEYQQRHPNIRLIDNPGKIVPTGLNAAIRIARGDFIIRIDGHTKISEDYLSECVETYKRTNAENVGGRMTAAGLTPFGIIVALATSTPFGVGGSRFHYSQKEEEADSVYMGAWPKKIFTEIGLFDEEMVRDQDDEFNYRINEHGGKIILTPNIKSVYTVRSTPKALWKQYFQYGFWKIRVLQKHPLQMSVRHFIPPLFVLSLLISTLLTLTVNWGKWLLFLIVFSYLIANLAASIVTALKKGWKHLFLLPVAFFIIHLSYGFGFLAGLIKFWNRWSDKKGKVPTY